MNPKVVRLYARRLSRERGRPVAPAEAEAEMGQIAVAVSNALAPRFVFGYHTREDVAHEGVIIALEILAGDRYDPSRPLENFLYVHLKRRLSNLVRRDFFRAEPPCSCCDAFGAPVAPCKRWLEWHRRNTSKRNLMRPLDMAGVDDEHEPRMSSPSVVHQEAVSEELLGAIDANLPPELRSDYLRMREHVSIPKARRQRVREAVLAIIGGLGDGGESSNA